jgi:hypothetical protein
VAAADVDLSVEVQGDDIVVTLPGTSYVVTYYRAAAFPQQLLTKSHSGREDEDATMTQAEFHARAWKAASPYRHWFPPKEPEKPRVVHPGLLLTMAPYAGVLVHHVR